MGNQIAHSQSPVSGDFHTFLLEYPSLSPHGELLTATKFLKASQCHLEKEGLVFTKLYIKREPAADFDLSHLKMIADTLQGKLTKTAHPNTVSARFFETKKACFLVRQYFHSTLFQKFHRHPFPTEVEKLWFAYQLLEAVRQLHAVGVCHGDLKSENVLLTSWNWLMLADVSGWYKPTYLEEANLTTFKFFFQTNKRERCYLAPERFYSRDGGGKEGQLDPSMDIFSLGCVLAEIFFDGEALFTYSQLMSYRRGDFDPGQVLAQVKAPQVRDLILHMIQLNPASRHNIERYCQLWQSQVFPGCFASVLHPMLKAVIAIDTLTSADSRVMLIGKNAEVIWTQVLGTKVVPNYETGGTEMVDSAPVPHTIYPDAILIVIDFVCASLRNVLRPSTKILAVSIVLSYISYLSDDIKLHRVLPYFISLLMDQQERSKVKIATLKAVKAVLMSIKQLSSNDLLIFDEYIWPSVSTLRHDESSVVQAAFADHLADFAEIGRVFLELERHLQKEHSDRASSYDTQIEEVRKSIMSTFKELYSKDNVMVHKALTNKLGDLCAFFGKKLTSNHVLPLIIPWLSRIWDRRILTLEQIPKVVQVIGYSALTGYIYPCMEDGLKDKEEHIVFATLKAFRLIDVPVTHSEVQMFAKSCPLLLHPNQWIKDEMVLFIKKMIEKMDVAENYLRIRPVLQPFLSLSADLLFAVSHDIVQTHIVKSFRRKTYESMLISQDLTQLLPQEEAYLQLVSDHIRMAISSEEFGRSVTRSERPETLKQYSLDEGNELELAIFHKVAPNLTEAKSIIEGSKPVSDSKVAFSGKVVENLYAKSSVDSPFEGFCPRGRLICCVNEHESAVTSLAVTEDSTVFLSASKDSTVRIWRMKNLQK